jgi:hypothetical protein
MRLTIPAHNKVAAWLPEHPAEIRHQKSSIDKSKASTPAIASHLGPERLRKPCPMNTMYAPNHTNATSFGIGSNCVSMVEQRFQPSARGAAGRNNSASAPSAAPLVNLYGIFI